MRFFLMPTLNLSNNAIHCRVYSTVKPVISVKLLETFNKKYIGLETHSGIKHTFFDYLSEQSNRGFTAKQFQIYRDTIFARTLTTIPSIAHVIIAAAYNQDDFTIARAGSNLHDEAGRGNPQYTHSLLLEKSHNFHAETIFGIPPLKLSDAMASDDCVSEVEQFQETQSELYTHSDYPVILGASMAQELAADAMLTEFYTSLFLPYKDYYDPIEFDNKVAKYFFDHIGEPGSKKVGAEVQHGIDSKQSAVNMCQTEYELKQVFFGANQFLNAQQKLWDSLHHMMKEKCQEECVIKPFQYPSLRH